MEVDINHVQKYIIHLNVVQYFTFLNLYEIIYC